MLYRKRAPNQYKWNGIGGKIEEQETPDEAVRREVMEEAGFSLQAAIEIHYAGIVTWSEVEDAWNSDKGMATYIAEFPDEFIDWKKKEIEEGVLEWKSLEWVCDSKNKEVVSNIPAFLPRMMKKGKPKEYHCVFSGSDLEELVERDLD